MFNMYMFYWKKKGKGNGGIENNKHVEFKQFMMSFLVLIKISWYGTQVDFQRQDALESNHAISDKNSILPHLKINLQTKAISAIYTEVTQNQLMLLVNPYHAKLIHLSHDDNL